MILWAYGCNDICTVYGENKCVIPIRLFIVVASRQLFNHFATLVLKLFRVIINTHIYFNKCKRIKHVRHVFVFCVRRHKETNDRHTLFQEKLCCLEEDNWICTPPNICFSNWTSVHPHKTSHLLLWRIWKPNSFWYANCYFYTTTFCRLANVRNIT